METRKEKYKEYLKSEEWKDLREYALFKNRRKNNGLVKCVDCEITNAEQYDVHHWQYPHDLSFDLPKYHIVLCHRCHGIAHDKIELSEKETIEREKANRLMMSGGMSKLMLTIEYNMADDELSKLSHQEAIDLYQSKIKGNKDE